MLGWSINLFRIFGIQLAVHATFFLLLAYVAYDGWRRGGQIGLVWQVWLTIFFFLCVVLHELGHSLTARAYGVKVPRILLLPIGGMAEMDRIPRKPSAEFLITIAGPAVNFVIAALLLPVVWGIFWSPDPIREFSAADTLATLFQWNIAMGIFNLLPVYPMDGGRILRSVLALWLPYLRATWWAVMIARVLAPLLAFAAVYFLDSWMLAILFLFILSAGTAEYRILVRREQEEAYFAEVARRVAAQSKSDEPSAPPLLGRDPS